MIAAIDERKSTRSEVAAVWVGATYVVGLLVVNCDLARFGLISLDLARPEYVLAGVLAVLLLATAGVVDTVVFVFISVAIKLAKRTTLDLRRHQLLGYVALLFTLHVALLFLSDDLSFPQWPPQFQFRSLPLLMKLLGCALPLVLTLGYLGAVSEMREAGSVLDGLWRIILNPFQGYRIIAVVAFAVAAVLFYATWVYPSLAREFGGGRRPAVLLVGNESLIFEADRVGIGWSLEGNVVGPAVLVLETSDRYVIANPQPSDGARHPRSVVSLRKDLVRSLVYENARGGKRSDGPPR